MISDFAVLSGGSGSKLCAAPIRLEGRTIAVDPRTGESRVVAVAGAVDPLLKACGQRRATVCAACAAVYRSDAWQLIAAGLRGGKGVTELVIERDVVFGTFTAPSFGPVHSRRIQGDSARRCRPRSAGSCAHGRSRECETVHADDDPVLGEPICFDCFDYRSAVMFNGLSTDLWRRTTIGIRRALAAELGVAQNRLASVLKLVFVKVAEPQRRGLIHFHAVIRLDGPEGAGSPPERGADVATLAKAIERAATHVEVPYPDECGLSGRVKWGTQLDIQVIGREMPVSAAAAYIAKYCSKSSVDSGALDRRLTVAALSRLSRLGLSDHQARLVTTAWDLGRTPSLGWMRNWAHTFGFRGHWLTKSPGYSTTFGALRSARASWVAAAEGGAHGEEVEIKDWRYAGRVVQPAVADWLANASEAH